MDIASYLPIILLGVALVGGFYGLVRMAGEAALIRLADQEPGAGIWQVWKDWRSSWRSDWRLGWAGMTWRLAAIHLLVTLAALPAGIAALACMAVPLGGGLFRGAPIPTGRMAIAVGWAMIILVILSVPLSALGAYVRLAQRAAVLENCGALAALRRGLAVARRHAQEVFTLWLVLGTLQLLYALVILPLVSFLAIAGMALAWLVGALIFFAADLLAASLSAYWVAVVAGGLVFVLVLYLPMSLVDGLMSTYVSVSWTHTYRKLING